MYKRQRHDKNDQEIAEGLGLRNMHERMDQMNGYLRIVSTNNGTKIEASVPLTHMLRPEEQTKESA